MNWFLCVGVLVAALFSNSEALRARCSFPGHPKNGYLSGDWINRLEGSTLRLVCDAGYELKGTRQAVCRNEQWDATLGTCEAVMCQPPKTSRLSISDPPSCLTGPTPYSTHCKMSCPPGYPDEAILYCNKAAKWEGRDVVCQDYQSPVIECPSQNKVIVLKADPGKATATIRLPTPKYTDNSEAHGGKLDFSATLDGQPISVQEKHELAVKQFGNSVKYVVKDEAGNQATCEFYYRVEDKEPPKIKNCPGNITKTTNKGEDYTRVGWKEPTATDNSGEDVHVFCNRVNGGEYYQGSSLVVYTFMDKHSNSAFCKFYVTVKLPCIDHTDFPIATLIPGITIPDPNNACSIPAADLKKCGQRITPTLPMEFVWKEVCRKTCNAC